MHKKVLHLTLLFALLVMMLITEGCGKKVGKGTVQSMENNLIETYVIPDGTGDWGYPTPYGLIPRGPGFMRMNYIFDTLIWKNEEGDFIPALAKKWAYNEKENTYTFDLQDSATWHDGTPITANDIVFTVEYMKEHPIPWMNIKPIDRVVSNSEHQVTFKLKEKWAPFYGNIAGSMPILPEHIYKNIDDPRHDLSELATIGSGPFKLVAYNGEKGEYVYEAFKDYYQGCPIVEKLQYFHMNPQMQPQALLQGKVDAIFTNGDAEQLFKDKDITIIRDIATFKKLAFNHDKAPFNQKEFRHAIAYFINRDNIIDIAHRGHAFKGNAGIFPSKSSYFEEGVQQYTFDLEKGAQILKQLGYIKEGDYYKKDGKILGLKVLGHERVRRDVDIIVEQLRHAGIKAEAVYQDIQIADQMLISRDFDISVVESAAIGDPIFLNRDILGKSATSDQYDQSVELNNLLKQQLSAVNTEERHGLLKALQKVYAEELPSYQLYFSKFVYAHNGKVDLYFTEDGLSIGIPLAPNKMSFIK
ncbi:ABC transporter substrate-binding protein [Vallitalea pronyensis]|uniref:ABC transporter substrate-binding protein n=1 Tax=Vallitalea pronyensis TaxID=1348613 RepID=A0A8J8MPT1_9FIRM|nr:ABC transporter substrate-binding protein [Vallitalea pronyensis]QUI25327.1 ABC transporter substrate-binding protein [Vallitalea pronyensis]